MCGGGSAEVEMSQWCYHISFIFLDFSPWSSIRLSVRLEEKVVILLKNGWGVVKLPPQQFIVERVTMSITMKVHAFCTLRSIFM